HRAVQQANFRAVILEAIFHDYAKPVLNERRALPEVPGGIHDAGDRIFNCHFNARLTPVIANARPYFTWTDVHDYPAAVVHALNDHFAVGSPFYRIWPWGFEEGLAVDSIDLGNHQQVIDDETVQA